MIFITKSLTLPISVLAPNLTGILVGHSIPQLFFLNERNLPSSLFNENFNLDSIQLVKSGPSITCLSTFWHSLFSVSGASSLASPNASDACWLGACVWAACQGFLGTFPH